MALDLVQWTFLTRVLGWEIELSEAPETVRSASAHTETARTFDPSNADTEALAAVTTQVGAWAQSIRDAGRSQPSDMDDVTWNAHVAQIRGTIADTRELRGRILTELARTDLDTETRAALEALRTEVNAALVEALDLEPAHGPTNHLKITQDAMGRRALYGKDPRDRGGAPDMTKRATRFTSPEAFLQCHDAALCSQAFANEVAARTDVTDPDRPVVLPSKRYFKIELKLEDVFGPDYLDAVEGQTYIGSGSARNKIVAAMGGGSTGDADALLGDTGDVGLSETDLENGTVRIDFFFVDGAWELSTMYPQVAGSVTRDRTRDMRYDRANDQWLKQDPSRGGDWHPFDPEAQDWITT